MTTVWCRLKQWAARLQRDVLTLWYAGRDDATPATAKLLALAIGAVWITAAPGTLCWISRA